VIIINNFYPEFFDDFSKSKEELSIKEAMSKGEHNKALTIYQKLVEESVGDGGENSPKTAGMYEAMANLHWLLGNKAEEKNHYLKSLVIILTTQKIPMKLKTIKQQLNQLIEKNEDGEVVDLELLASLKSTLQDKRIASKHKLRHRLAKCERAEKKLKKVKTCLKRLKLLEEAIA